MRLNLFDKSLSALEGDVLLDNDSIWFPEELLKCAIEGCSVKKLKDSLGFGDSRIPVQADFSGVEESIPFNSKENLDSPLEPSSDIKDDGNGILDGVVDRSALGLVISSPPKLFLELFLECKYGKRVVSYVGSTGSK